MTFYQGAKLTSAQYQQRMRSLFPLAYSEPAIINISKTESTLKVFTGARLVEMGSLPPCDMRVNMVIQDTDMVIAQVLGPPTLKKKQAMEKAAKEGRDLLDKVYQHATRFPVGDTRRLAEAGKDHHFHFGIWHSLGKATLGLTQETQQKNSTKGRKAVSDFIAWVQWYFVHFVEEVVKTDAVVPEYKADLEKTEHEHWPWLKDASKDAEDFCHKWWSTISPFQGFTSKPHNDPQDTRATILLNFGGAAYLYLPDYNTKIRIQPLDIVILTAKEVKHSTEQDPFEQQAGVSPFQRWACSCFFRKSIADHSHPAQEVQLELRRHKRVRFERTN